MDTFPLASLMKRQFSSTMPNTSSRHLSSETRGYPPRGGYAGARAHAKQIDSALIFRAEPSQRSMNHNELALENCNVSSQPESSGSHRYVPGSRNRRFIRRIGRNKEKVRWNKRSSSTFPSVDKEEMFRSENRLIPLHLPERAKTFYHPQSYCLGRLFSPHSLS